MGKIIVAQSAKTPNLVTLLSILFAFASSFFVAQLSGTFFKFEIEGSLTEASVIFLTKSGDDVAWLLLLKLRFKNDPFLASFSLFSPFHYS